MAAYGLEEVTRAGVDALANQIRTNPKGVAKFVGIGGRKKKRRSAQIVGRGKGMTTMVRSPVANNYRVKNTALKVRSVSGVTTITNINQITELSSTANFTVKTFQVNPGLGDLFPALQNHANAFQSYKFTKLVVRYTPVCGTQFNGDVSLAFATDAADPIPADMRELSQYPTLRSGSIRESLSMSIPLKSGKLFTRAGSVPNTDIKTYDMGKIFLVTDLASDIIKIGRVWIEYEVQLFTPKPRTCPAATQFTVANTAIDVPGTSVRVTQTESNLAFKITAPGTYFIDGLVESPNGVLSNIRSSIGDPIDLVEIQKRSAAVSGVIMFLATFKVTSTGTLVFEFNDSTITRAMVKVSEGSAVIAGIPF